MTADRRRTIPTLNDEAELALRFRAKAELRKRLRAIRRKIPVANRNERSEAIAGQLKALSAWTNARTIAGFVAMGDEPNPAVALDSARDAGSRIVLPRVESETDMTFRAAKAHSAEAHSAKARSAKAELETHPLGFKQPGADAPIVAPSEIDLVLVPALAADVRGHRLGYGGGFYDRALPNFGHATTVALVFHFQLMAELPNTPGDVPVRWVVTDQGIYEAKPELE